MRSTLLRVASPARGRERGGREQVRPHVLLVEVPLLERQFAVLIQRVVLLAARLDGELVQDVDVRPAAPHARLALPRLGDAVHAEALSLVRHLRVHVLHVYLVVPRVVLRDLPASLGVVVVRLKELGVVAYQVAPSSQVLREELLALARGDEVLGVVDVPEQAVFGERGLGHGRWRAVGQGVSHPRRPSEPSSRDGTFGLPGARFPRPFY